MRNVTFCLTWPRLFLCSVSPDEARREESADSRQDDRPSGSVVVINARAENEDEDDDEDDEDDDDEDEDDGGSDMEDPADMMEEDSYRAYEEDMYQLDNGMVTVYRDDHTAPTNSDC